MKFITKTVGRYRVVSEDGRESDAHHETGVTVEKTLDSLMYHMMRGDTSDEKKKQAILKTVEDYVETQGIDNEYMTEFAHKLSLLAKALKNKYSDGEEEKKPEDDEESSED